MLRPEWFVGLGSVVALLVLVRLVLRRPLFASEARSLSRGDAALSAVSIALLVFHCAAMFAPEVISAIDALDRPAATVSDLNDPVGQAAYWIPAVLLVGATRHLWWPAPLGLAVALLAVGWTMYGSFTLTQHLVTIVVAGVGVTVVALGLVTRRVGGQHAR